MVTESGDMGSRAGKVLHSEAVDSGNGDRGQGSGRRRFGAFEVDLSAGELRRNGFKVKLQEQPLQVLALLLERPGEVVSRDDLRNRLWAADTFVDFDHSLNAASSGFETRWGTQRRIPDSWKPWPGVATGLWGRSIPGWRTATA